MKNTRKGWVLLFLGLLVGMTNLCAQTVDACAESFGISTNISPSLCQSNGRIEITLTGEHSNYYNFQYALQPDKTGDFSIGATTNTTLTGIPAGRYSIIVSAVCKSNEKHRVTKTFSDIVVPGTYKVIQASFNQSLSVATLPNCSTGRIVLNVKEGNGKYTFTIVKAPDGVPVPQTIVPIKKGDDYTFPTDSYPEGTYRVEVKDGCYTASVELNVGRLTKLPTLYNESQTIFTPKPVESYDCSVLRASVSPSNESLEDFELKKYIEQGLLEISMVPAGGTPTTWHTFPKTTEVLSYNIAPEKVSDLYTPQSLEVHIRAKACPTFVRKFFINVKKPYITTSVSQSSDCLYMNYTISPWQDFDGMYCFPLTLTLFRGSSSKKGEVIATKTINHHKDPQVFSIPYETGDYHLTVTDKEGKFTYTRDISSKYFLYFKTIPHCDSYVETVQPASFLDCLPVTIEVFEMNGKSERKVTSLRYTTNNYLPTPPLKYGTLYEYRVRRDDQPNTLYTATRNVVKPDETYTMSTSAGYADACQEGWGKLIIKKVISLRSNTRINLTGPEGFEPQSFTDGGYNEVRSKSAYTPPGTYTMTATDECGIQTATYEHTGFYKVQSFSYTSRLTCAGLVIRPTAQLTLLGASAPCYFRIKKGPEGGFVAQSIAQGGELTLSVEGTYELALCTSNSYASCPLRTIIVEYKRSALQLSTAHTAAYVCNAGDVNGHIIVKAENGVPPYTYELYDKTNTKRINIDHIVEPNDAWHYVYGKANEVFTIRMQDACGNRFAQQVTMLNMKLAIVAAVRRSVVCAGEKIELLSLPFDSYQWYDPKGKLISTQQNPVITNVKPSQTGIYRVHVRSNQCGSELDGYIKVTVLPCWAPVNPQLMNRSTPWQ
ncbi:MAG: hypothetical protein Q4D66_06990 [Bacteroidales bacterium]|nr:hypothetical protein [Bacteroidales bacterium]